MYLSKSASAAAILASVSSRVTGGGKANENYSQSHPHLKVHHLHLAESTVSTCILAGGVCGGALLRRGRLERPWGVAGERVRETGQCVSTAGLEFKQPA